MIEHILSLPDLLSRLLPHLSLTDAAASLCLTCRAAADGFRQLRRHTTTTSHAPRVIVCASDSQQLLTVSLTEDGELYPHATSTPATTEEPHQLQVFNARAPGE